jgi:hypothetical protein
MAPIVLLLVVWLALVLLGLERLLGDWYDMHPDAAREMREMHGQWED